MSFKNPKYLSLPLLMLVLLGMLSQSCYKEKFKIGEVEGPLWNPTWAVPLVNSRLLVSDILGQIDKEDIVIIDPATGLLALRYFDDVFSIPADSFIILPDQDTTLAQTFDAAAILALEAAPGGMAPFSMDIDVNFETPSGEALNLINFKGGTLAYNIVSTFPYPVNNFTVSIPELRDPSGVAYSRTFPVLVSGSAATESLPLAGYSLTLDNPSANHFEASLSGTFAIGGGGAVAPASIVATMSMTDPEFESLYGKFGTQSIETGIENFVNWYKDYNNI